MKLVKFNYFIIKFKIISKLDNNSINEKGSEYLIKSPWKNLKILNLCINI